MTGIRFKVRKFLRHFRGDDRGMVFVEAGITISVLFLLMVAVWDLGSVFVRQMQITNAVRAGTQYAIVRKPIAGDLSQIIQAVKNAAPDSASPTVNATLYCECSDGSVVTCSGTCSDGQPRKSFVKINYAETFNLLLGFPGVGSAWNLTDEATVRLN